MRRVTEGYLRSSLGLRKIVPGTAAPSPGIFVDNRTLAARQPIRRPPIFAEPAWTLSIMAPPNTTASMIGKASAEKSPINKTRMSWTRIIFVFTTNGSRLQYPQLEYASCANEINVVCFNLS